MWFITWFTNRKRKEEQLREVRHKPISVDSDKFYFPLSILGFGLTIPRALVVQSNEHLVVAVDQPNNSIRYLVIKTSKSFQYKPNDIVKLHGTVERQTLPIVINATSVNFIGRKEDYEVR